MLNGEHRFISIVKFVQDFVDNCFENKMPGDSKKNADKKKHEPKEQRKPRRNQARKSDNAEKPEEIKAAPLFTVPQKPVYEDPGPEFYKNLKRETEEIVKITEAENAKYKKKEIQSNWAKYEMLIASYEDVDEQDIGADYEKLIQAPLSSGSHFQFKHEKSWNTSTAPSLYDKYFEINMDNLSIAISTIPFYERNDIDQSLFSETDLLSMNNRASKYKLKYYNDKKYSTPETEAQDGIVKSLRNKDESIATDEKPLEEIALEYEGSDKYDINLEFNVIKTESVISVNSNKPIKQDNRPKSHDRVDDIDDELIFEDNKSDVKDSESQVISEKISSIEKEFVPPIIQQSNTTNITEINENSSIVTNTITKEHPVASKMNPVIESPEDLEKWLDDFLDS